MKSSLYIYFSCSFIFPLSYFPTAFFNSFSFTPPHFFHFLTHLTPFSPLFASPLSSLPLSSCSHSLPSHFLTNFSLPSLLSFPSHVTSVLSHPLVSEQLPQTCSCGVNRIVLSSVGGTCCMFFCDTYLTHVCSGENPGKRSNIR